MCQHHQNVNFTPTILVRIHNENFQAISININSSSSGCDRVASSQMGNTTKCSGLFLSMLLGMGKMMIDDVTCFDTNPPVSRMHSVQWLHSTMSVELHAYHDHSLIIISCPGAVCIWEVSISTANKRGYLITGYIARGLRLLHDINRQKQTK